MSLWGKQKKVFARIPVDALRPGMHVSLSERWLDHPFLLNEFTLDSEDQIAIIRAMGMTSVPWCEALSVEIAAAAPALAVGDAPGEEHAPSSVVANEAAALLAAAQAQRDERKRRAAASRARIAKTEQAYAEATRDLRDAFACFYAEPHRALAKTAALVNQAATAFGSGEDVSLIMMSERLAHANQHAHGVNVMLLSLLLGRACGMERQALENMASGALYHDIGKANLQGAVRMRAESERSKHEEAAYRLHVNYGEEITARLATFGREARAAVAMHHERFDGTGYPRGLKGNALPVAARVVAVVNRYDNLCNPLRIHDALTPAEALSRMFRAESAHFDPRVLAAFVKSMGVYPPGTVVELSNAALGVIVGINRTNLLRPTVTLHEPAVPKDEAPVVDLEREPALKIVRAIRPAEVDEEIREYLNASSRVAYFYSAGDA